MIEQDDAVIRTHARQGLLKIRAGLLNALGSVAREVSPTPPRSEKSVCEVAVLIPRTAGAEFEAAIAKAATAFDQNFTLEYSGPWPAYSFVRLRLQPVDRPSAA